MRIITLNMLNKGEITMAEYRASRALFTNALEAVKDKYEETYYPKKTTLSFGGKNE